MRKRGPKARPVEERFIEKVSKLPNGCWEWQGQRNHSGYGVFYLVGKYVGAHRVSYGLFVAPIPDGMMVCHHCDNPPCVNPAHLFVGTAKDNTQDMIQKGRGQWNMVGVLGERHRSARLTEVEVASVRRRWADGETMSAMAREKGVHISTISRVVREHTWRRQGFR